MQIPQCVLHVHCLQLCDCPLSASFSPTSSFQVSLGSVLTFSVPRKVSLFQVCHVPVSSSPAGKASSPSLVFLSNLQLHLQNLPQARILCHLSCVLTLSLQWVCSLCSSIFKEVFKLPEIIWEEACRLSTHTSYATVQKKGVPISIPEPLFPVSEKDLRIGKGPK